MPTYDYSCASCRTVFDVFERLNAERGRACPKCGKKRARRLMGCGASALVRSFTPHRPRPTGG